MIDAPAPFARALDSLRGHTFRPELRVHQVPPPRNLAPWAVALEARISSSRTGEDFRGRGRFVVLYDPAGQPAWEGPFRLVSTAAAPTDEDMAADPLLGEVAWSWLADALTIEDASYHNLVGTVSRIYNESFGGLERSSFLTELELRASWSPDNANLFSHLEAWVAFLARVGGLAPAGVATLPRLLHPSHD
ncbi:DUF3000 domain-containing protein [Neoactinobaculum massilliense]|uniref:DUF3000 domain-containing protein n=1 Tax=Neoactinobaculum massilliense TaxID=2364794 RepID=UPI0013DD9DFE|nr:DUF3000 domain-containing protein [Neoactinobaculum massilliense]